MNVITVVAVRLLLFIGLGAHGLPTSTNLDAHDVWSNSSEHLPESPSLMPRGRSLSGRKEVWEQANYVFQFHGITAVHHEEKILTDCDTHFIGRFLNKEKHTIVAAISHNGYYIDAIPRKIMESMYGQDGSISSRTGKLATKTRQMPAVRTRGGRLSWDELVETVETLPDFADMMKRHFGDGDTLSQFMSWRADENQQDWVKRIVIWTPRVMVVRQNEPAQEWSPVAQAIANEFEYETKIKPDIKRFTISDAQPKDKNPVTHFREGMVYRRVVRDGIIATDLWFGSLKVVEMKESVSEKTAIDPNIDIWDASLC